jgi:hypothetical protein
MEGWYGMTLWRLELIDGRVIVQKGFSRVPARSINFNSFSTLAWQRVALDL